MAAQAAMGTIAPRHAVEAFIAAPGDAETTYAGRIESASS